MLGADARARSLMADGYLDVLSASVPPTGPVQELMLSPRLAGIYERYWRPALGRLATGPFGVGMRRERRIARELLRLTPGDRVLDVACGPGNFSRDFARSVGPEGLVVGIDVSEAMLARAVLEAQSADLPQLAYVRGDAQELPFLAQSFDAVCCFAALHLFSDPMRALDRMSAVLRRGGRIAIFTTIRRRLAPAAPQFFAQSLTGVRLFERHEVVDALEARGFEALERRTAGVMQFVCGERR